jgi:hypothetical protein
MKPITREAAKEMADHLRSAYPIDRNEVADFLEAAAIKLPSTAQTVSPAEAMRSFNERPLAFHEDHLSNPNRM